MDTLHKNILPAVAAYNYSNHLDACMSYFYMSCYITNDTWKFELWAYELLWNICYTYPKWVHLLSTGPDLLYFRPRMESRRFRPRQLQCHEVEFWSTAVWLKNLKKHKTGVINDPLGQPTVPAGSDCRLILKFWNGRTDGWSDTLCEKKNYRLELWSASWIKKRFFPGMSYIFRCHCRTVKTLRSKSA